MTDLAVVILTFNEAEHIERVLQSLAPLRATAFVVDSFSTDGTPDLAGAAGATVVQHRFVTQAQQFQWAMDTLPIDHAWVMRLDADETLTPDLTREIEIRLPTLPVDVTGVNLKRRHVFLGRWIRHGGRYPVTLLRIWRRGAARVEQRWMDEHMLLLHGRSITFEHDFSDINLKDMTHFITKHNIYATREAIDVLSARYNFRVADTPSYLGHPPVQAAAKRFLKERIYNHLPIWCGPLGYFLFRYFVQLGCLDGTPGLIYHFMQGYWYRFLVGAKVWEYDRAIVGLQGAEDRMLALEALTGQPIVSQGRRAQA